MKKNANKNLLCVLFVLISLFVVGCSKDEIGNENQGPFQMESNLLMDSKLFRESLSERTSTHAFEVLSVERDGAKLALKTRGSDEAGSFQFVWDGRIQESFPMGIKLIMRYTGSAADFDPGREMDISVNLQKIMGERENLDDYHFYVINGSKMQTATLNPDGSTSFEQN